ncbi:hypothetical protein AgCh_009783 [Apium graveolens]
MKSTADNHRREVQYFIGEKVYHKLQPYRKKSLANRPFEKLAARFYGPFEITERIGQVAYRLNLPPTSKLHPVFHVLQLKKAVGSTSVSSALPMQLGPELELLVEPEEVLNLRNRLEGQTVIADVLIKWKNTPDFDATWESADVVMEQFPHFHLEDKVKVLAGGGGEQYLKEAGVRAKKYEADMRQLLLGTYLSDKDIFGDNIFQETGVDGVKASRYPGTESYVDPVAYLNKKEASAKSAANTSTGKGKQSLSELNPTLEPTKDVRVSK